MRFLIIAGWALILGACAQHAAGPSDAGAARASEGAVDRPDMRLALHGMFRYMADAAQIEECMTGRSYPVAMLGDYLALEQAYTGMETLAPGAPVMAYFEGEISPRPAMEGDALVPTVSVRRFIGLFPDQSCERAMSTASLANTYWRIASLGDLPIDVAAGDREPHLILRAGESRYVATAGCNQISGRYLLQGRSIELQPGPMTRMACPGPLDELERRLIEALGASRSWAIYAQVLELFDAAGDSIATFEAVYLP